MNIQEIAKQFNVSETALTDCLDFIKRSILGDPRIEQAFREYPEETIRAAIRAWRDKGVAFYTELLEQKTPQGKYWYNEIVKALEERARKENESN